MSYGWREADSGELIEFCDECGFDGRSVDLAGRLEGVLAALMALQADPQSRLSPAAGVWSAAEYIAHCLDMIGETIAVVRDGRPEPRAKVLDLPAGAKQLQLLMAAEDADSWSRRIDLGGPFPASPHWMFVHVLHDLEHHRLDICRGYARLQLAATEGPTVKR